MGGHNSKQSEEVQDTSLQYQKLLNELTPDNIDQIVEDLNDNNLRKVETQRCLVEVLLQKVISNPTSWELYASLCERIGQRLPKFPDPQHDKKETTFRQILQNTCMEIECKPAQEVHQQMLAKTLFIGHLFKKCMLEEANVHKLLGELIFVDSAKDEDVECIYKLLMAVGEHIDKSKMEKYLNQLKRFIEDDDISSRHRFNLREVMDLHRIEWQKSSPNSTDFAKKLRSKMNDTGSENGQSDCTSSPLTEPPAPNTPTPKPDIHSRPILITEISKESISQENDKFSSANSNSTHTNKNCNSTDQTYLQINKESEAPADEKMCQVQPVRNADEACDSAVKKHDSYKGKIRQEHKIQLEMIALDGCEKLGQDIINDGITDPEVLKNLTEQIFEKALSVPSSCDTYARLCACVSHSIQNHPCTAVQDMDTEFRKLLLARFSEEFTIGNTISKCLDHDEVVMKINNGDCEFMIDEVVGSTDRANEAHTQNEEDNTKASHRMLNAMQFAGFLFNHHVFEDAILHKLLDKLTAVELAKAEDVECLCKLIMAVGEQMDNSKMRTHMDMYFSRIERLSNSGSLKIQHQFLLKELIQIRANGWMINQKINTTEKDEESHIVDIVEKPEKETMITEEESTMDAPPENSVREMNSTDDDERDSMDMQEENVKNEVDDQDRDKIIFVKKPNVDDSIANTANTMTTHYTEHAELSMKHHSESNSKFSIDPMKCAEDMKTERKSVDKLKINDLMEDEHARHSVEGSELTEDCNPKIEAGKQDENLAIAEIPRSEVDIQHEKVNGKHMGIKVQEDINPDTSRQAFCSCLPKGVFVRKKTVTKR